MIQQTAEITESLRFLLAKGVGWLALCGSIRWSMPRSILSWRLSLTGLALLTLAGLFLVRVRDRYQGRKSAGRGRVRALASGWTAIMPYATATLVMVVGLGLAIRSVGSF